MNRAIFLFVALTLGWSTFPVFAAERNREVYGEFINRHPVRDFHMNCDKPQKECPMVLVEDNVTLLRQSESTVKVLVNTVGNELHVCSFEGTGKLSNGFIRALHADRTVRCELKIRMIGKDTVAISQASAECERLCGAMASFYAGNLKRRF